MNYKTIVNGKMVEYGPYTENVNAFTDEERLALQLEMVRVNYPEDYENRKDDEQFIKALGGLISIEERYEALLEELPQNTYSYAGSHPLRVAEAVEKNSLNREITKDDVSDMIARCETLDGLKEELSDYFELEEDYE
ncbi:hypothetical protein [Streptococcus pluranimalium]|uniref:hypothetical protein n=1 Tax=Streptococcus pluranimalium TaxID=82348 RepID=UPI0029303E28|nr:hypothetical protein [Streptococcus pluranimalium]